MYAKDLYEPKYQFLIDKRESIRLKHFNNPEAFIEYSNDMEDVYKNIDEYNPDKENKILIVFDDMIADMIQQKNTKKFFLELYQKLKRLMVGKKIMLELWLILTMIYL